MSILAPARKKRAFIEQLPKSAALLDVGCGTGSPGFVKSIRPDIYYVGLDIGDYYQTEQSKAQADEYIITPPETFDRAIAELGASRFDAVISAHNIEHCYQPDRVMQAMCGALRPDGKLFMSFPCEESVNMPSRKGCLNFYDDKTHTKVPVWQDILRTLAEGGMALDFAAPRYRPWMGFLIGLACEPFVAPFGRQAPRATTWALYGFESVIWATKK